MEENRKCKGCNKIKRITSFNYTTRKKENKERKRSPYCRECYEEKNYFLEDLFAKSEERKLIPLIKADIEFLRKKAEEIGLTRLTKEERDEE